MISALANVPRVYDSKGKPFGPAMVNVRDKYGEKANARNAVEFAFVSYPSIADLDKPDNVIATVAGTSQQKFSQRVFKQAKVVGYNDTGAAVLEVMQGRATVYMGDSVSNALRAKERPTEVKNIVFPNSQTEWNSLNHAVRYEDLDLLQFVDTYIRTMKLRGWYKELADKWGLPPELATGPN